MSILYASIVATTSATPAATAGVTSIPLAIVGKGEAGGGSMADRHWRRTVNSNSDVK